MTEHIPAQPDPARPGPLRRKRGTPFALESTQLHDSPTTAAGQPRRSGYIRLREVGLPLDGSPAPVSAADSASDWAHRAGVLYERLVLLAARVEPYAAAPGSAGRRVRAAVAGAGGTPGAGQPAEQRLK